MLLRMSRGNFRLRSGSGRRRDCGKTEMGHSVEGKLLLGQQVVAETAKFVWRWAGRSFSGQPRGVGRLSGQARRQVCSIV